MSDILAVSGLHAGYGAGDILKGIDVALPAGKIITVIGPNGSGKSTLIKTLAGLLPVRQGEIVLAGARLNEMSAPKRVMAGMSYVPQEYNVFRNLTVLENLQIAREFMSGGRAPKKNGKVIDELFLGTLSRAPLPEERQFAVTLLDKNRKEGAQNVQWALLNLVEFLYNF